MGARIDDSDLLARIADLIVRTKGATLMDALKALDVPESSHRRLYRKWEERGLGLVTEAAWRASAARHAIMANEWDGGYEAGLEAGRANERAFAASLASLDSKKRSLISRVKARFWE